MSKRREHTGSGRTDAGCLFRRHMAGRDDGLPEGARIIGAVVTQDERRRYFFGSGTTARAFDAKAALGRAVIETVLDVGGSCMVTARGDGPIAFASGELAEIDAQAAETDLLAGRNVIFGSRIDETPDQVADWILFHARTVGADGVLILDRSPERDEGFDRRLGERLDGLEMRVVLLSFSIALGKEGDVAQNHVLNAPGAPGKARMERPEPDRWRAPLGEPLLYELCKWAFLSEARAVMALDVSDILDPDGPNPFDLCQVVPGGCIGLAGMPIYPWRVRVGEEARFGDHICRPFDLSIGSARWGLAPRRSGLSRPWRLVRVADAPDGMPVLRFFRAMGIRFPGVPTAKLVPKTSLIEDQRLIALSEGLFGHDPVRAPATEIRVADVKEARQQETTIVTTMKNEGPFLLEWIAYHRAIGVTGFLVYTNDCTDGTDTFLSLLQEKGLCQHRANPWRPGGPTSPQYAALQAAADEPVIQSADWLICMDVDEYINIKIGDGTLAALFEATGDANMISMTWRLFGNSGVVAYEDRPIIAQFDRCAPEIIRKPHQAWGFKTLFRNIEIFRKLGVHRPKSLKPEFWDHIHWVNGSGRPMPNGMLRNGWRSTMSTYGYDWVQLNHYAVRSVESFLVKRDRGRVNHVDRDQGKNYWFRMNHNIDADSSIQRMIPKLEAEMARLLADPDIRAAHEHSVACHRTKIAELMAREDQRTLFGELTGERMVRLCRMQHHFGSAVFSAGPQVIPDEIALSDDLAPDFFFTVEHEGEASH